MKEWLKYLPGFRSDKTWKKVTASIFYAIYLLFSFLVGLDFFLIVGGLALLAFGVLSLIKSLRNKKALKTPVLLLLIAIIFFTTGVSASSYKDATVKKLEEASIALAENEKLQTRNNDLEKENNDLEKEISLLITENENFQVRNEELQGTNEKLQLEIKELKEEKEKLVEKEREREEAEEQRLAEERKKEEAKKQEQQTASSSSNNSSKAVSSDSSSSSQTSTDKQSREVLITRTGKRYHNKVCGNGNYFSATLKEAQSRGLTPCQKCY